jgi:hypothetical protein
MEERRARIGNRGTNGWKSSVENQIEFYPPAFRSADVPLVKAVKAAGYNLKDWQGHASHQIAGRLRITVHFLRASYL